MQIKSHSAAPKADSSAPDAARYGMRLADIAEHLASTPGENVARARELLTQAADAAQEASRLIEGITTNKLRLHVNVANQPDLLSETARYLLEKNAGDAPITLHRGGAIQNLPFGVHVSARLVSQLRALLGDDAVWTEARK
ncbi:MAG TPA: hypothetical protein VGM37_06035 [Armatimonadota bacterium]|jgi:hypothetical protein